MLSEQYILFHLCVWFNDFVEYTPIKSLITCSCCSTLAVHRLLHSEKKCVNDFAPKFAGAQYNYFDCYHMAKYLRYLPFLASTLSLLSAFSFRFIYLFIYTIPYFHYYDCSLYSIHHQYKDNMNAHRFCLPILF